MVDESEKQNLIRKVDCIRIPVTNLESGLRFYRDSLGHELIWCIETSVGLRIPESKPELVIHTEPDEFEVDQLLLIDLLRFLPKKLLWGEAILKKSIYQRQLTKISQKRGIQMGF